MGGPQGSHFVAYCRGPPQMPFVAFGDPAKWGSANRSEPEFFKEGEFIGWILRF